ncbi:helix-turn-helix protein [compost metagenome]
MSRDDFADAVGVPPTTLKNYEMGYREVGGEFLMKLSSNQQFHRFTLWLLSGKKEPSVGQIGPEDFVKV